MKLKLIETGALELFEGNGEANLITLMGRKELLMFHPIAQHSFSDVLLPPDSTAQTHRSRLRVSSCARVYSSGHIRLHDTSSERIIVYFSVQSKKINFINIEHHFF